MLLIFYNSNNPSDNISYNHTLGIFFGILTAICYSSVIIINKSLKDISSSEQTLGQFFSAIILLLGYILIFEDFNFKELSPVSSINLIIIGVIHTGLPFLYIFLLLKI